jgi:hypothetical protein
MASPAFRLKTVGCIRTGCGKLPSGNSLGAFVVLKVRAEAAVSGTVSGTGCFTPASFLGVMFQRFLETRVYPE